MSTCELVNSSKRIAIVRALPGLGDLLCTVPAWRALRSAFPKAEITLIGLPWAKSFVERYAAYIDSFLQFPGYPGIPEIPPAIQQLPGFFAHAQQQGFDLALQMHGSGIISNPFTVMLGASINAGFYLPGHYCPDPNYFLPYPTQEPEVWRHLRLMEFLGISLVGTDLEFPLQTEDFLSLQAISGLSQLKAEQYVCIHPGASTQERCWSPQKFGVVADFLAESGFQVVLTGTATETRLTQTVQELMLNQAINLTGCTSLGALAVLLKNSQLLVCNDTGVSHLAAALGVKSVVIFSSSEPHRWAPLNRDRHRIVVQGTAADVIKEVKYLLNL